MRLNFTIFLLIFFFTARPIAAQQSILEQKISLKFKNNTLEEAFAKMESLTAISFAYSSDLLPEKRFSRRFKNQKLKTILDHLLAKTNLIYIPQNKRILITLSEKPDLEEAAPKKEKFTLNGYFRDATNGEELIGGTVFILQTGSGSNSNAYGFYSLTLPKGHYHLTFSYLGYESQEAEVQLSANKRLDMELNPVEQHLREVVVVASKKDEGELVTEWNNQQIDLGNLENIPALLGEQDLMKTLQLLPGVQATGEGNGGFSIRGGSTDQSLILLDEAPVYNPAHLLGFFSIFNPDAIKTVRLMKGDIPAEFRGRLSSVLDIRMQEGNSKKFALSGGIGTIMARVKAEGRLAKGKGSFMVAGRRTYPDLIVKLFDKNAFKGSGIFFYDINAKANYRLNKKNRLFLSTYGGKDVFEFGDNFKINWGNTTSTLRWNHLFNDKLFSNTSLIFSDFDFTSSTNLAELANDETITPFSLRTRINDAHLKQVFNYYPHPNHLLKFGFNVLDHNIIPGRLIDEEVENFKNIKFQERKSMEFGLFVSHRWKIQKRWELNYGFHFSSLAVRGSNEYVFKYGRNGEVLDSTFYNDGEAVTDYGGVEPRIALTFFQNKRSIFKISFNRTIQYLQLLQSAFINNPASVWLPSSINIRPQKAFQWSIGHFRSFVNNRYSLSVEVYGNLFQNQIAYRDGANLDLGSDMESQLVFGKSWSYGAEFMLKKRDGRFRGWMSYTLSAARSRFSGISRGQIFRSENDRPHNIALVALYDIKKHCTFAANWVYSSGKLVTVPIGKYVVNGEAVNYYGGRNNFRMSNIHRLDLAIRWHKTGKRGAERYWSFSVHNFYGHRNPSFAFIKPESSTVKEISILGWLPSFTHFFEF